nr:molybdate ABC transporter substrate-binding protein [uncultured Pseudodesulfovibrio sp.]
MHSIRKSVLGLVALFLFFLVAMTGCQNNTESTQQRKTLVVFCGATMISPMMELARVFEQTHNVIVEMSYGGSQDLAKSIEVNQLGDIFIPGFKEFVDIMKVKGHVVDTEQVGQNELAIFVAKDNPKGLTGDLAQLVDPTLAVVIGHEDLGSVGKESKKVLSAQNIYESVVRNTVFMASDSKGLSLAIREGKADLVLNWKAVARLKGNVDSMEAIPIEGVVPRPLVMASLAHSANPELAKSFLQFSASPEGRAVFERFGF